MGNILREFPECKDRYRIGVRSIKGVDSLEITVEGGEFSKDKIEELSKRLKQETLLTFDRVEIVEKLQEGPLVIDEREGRTFLGHFLIRSRRRTRFNRKKRVQYHSIAFVLTQSSEGEWVISLTEFNIMIGKPSQKRKEE